MASMSTHSENENVLLNLCVRLGSLILKEEQKLAVEALLSFKDAMVVLPTGSVKPSFLNALIAPKFWQCIHPSLCPSRTKEPLVLTIITSFYNFASAEQVLARIHRFSQSIFLAVVAKYHIIDSQKWLGSIADTAFIFRRIVSCTILTQLTWADELDAQFNKSLRFPVRILLSGAVAFELLIRFLMKTLIVITKFILQT